MALSKQVKNLFIQLTLGTFSFVMAYVCFTLLESSVEGVWKGWKFGGGIAGFLGTWLLSNKLYSDTLSKDSTASDVILKDERKEPTCLGSYDVRMRKDYWDEIFLKIKNAQRRVVFIGGISSTLLTADILRKFASALENNQHLKISFIYESGDNRGRS